VSVEAIDNKRNLQQSTAGQVILLKDLNSIYTNKPSPKLIQIDTETIVLNEYRKKGNDIFFAHMYEVNTDIIKIYQQLDLTNLLTMSSDVGITQVVYLYYFPHTSPHY